MNKAHNAELKLFLEVELGAVISSSLRAFIDSVVEAYKPKLAASHKYCILNLFKLASHIIGIKICGNRQGWYDIHVLSSFRQVTQKIMWLALASLDLNQTGL